MQAVESALRGHPSVAECVVLSRTTRAGEPACVAFVVPHGSCASADIVAHAQALTPSLPALHVVQVSALPLLETGAVDEEALRSLPVIDSEAVARCRTRAAALGADSIAIREIPFRRRSLHVSRLLLESAEGLDLESVPASSEPRPSTSLDLEPQAAPVAAAAGPAIADGGPLVLGPGSPQTLLDALERAMRLFGSHAITYIEADLSENTQTYGELFDSARRVARGLQKLGVRSGSRVLLQIDRVRDFIDAFWGCVVVGAVPVPVTMAMVYDRSNSNAAKLRHAWQLLDDPLVLTSATLVAPILEFFRAEGLSVARVAAIEDLASERAGRRPAPARSS